MCDLLLPPGIKGLIVLKTYKSYKTLGYWSTDMLNFDLLQKNLEIVCQAYSVYEFSRKMFLILYSINHLY